MPEPTHLPFFTAADVARIFTEERQAKENDDARADGRAPVTVRPTAVRTVYAYRWWSLPAPAGQPPHRYQDNPMPAPVQLDGQRPIWVPAAGETLAELERRFRAWWNSRPGPGVGGGRPRKDRPVTPEPITEVTR